MKYETTGFDGNYRRLKPDHQAAFQLVVGDKFVPACAAHVVAPCHAMAREDPSQAPSATTSLSCSISPSSLVEGMSTYASPVSTGIIKLVRRSGGLLPRREARPNDGSREGIQVLGLLHTHRVRYETPVSTVHCVSLMYCQLGKGTNINVFAVGENLTRVFRAGQIATPLSDAESVDLSEKPKMAHSRLTELRFSQAPVRQNQDLLGWVKCKQLQTAASVKAVYQPLSRSAIVAVDAPMEDVIEILGKHGFVFVVGDRNICGFITPSDLDRHAVRSHFYLLISGIEMLLATLVRNLFPMDTIVGLLDAEITDRWKAANAMDSETDPVEYLYLRQLCDLFEKSPIAIADVSWTKSMSNKLVEVNQFRPTVMHPTRSLVHRGNAQQVAIVARDAVEVSKKLADLVNSYVRHSELLIN